MNDMLMFWAFSLIMFATGVTVGYNWRKPKEYEFRYTIQANDGRIVVETNDEKAMDDIEELLNDLLAILADTKESDV